MNKKDVLYKFFYHCILKIRPSAVYVIEYGLVTLTKELFHIWLRNFIVNVQFRVLHPLEGSLQIYANKILI